MTTAMFAQDIPLKEPPAKIGMDLFDAHKGAGRCTQLREA